MKIQSLVKKIICIPPIIFLKVCLFNLIQGYPFLTSAFPVKCNDRRVIKVVTKGSNEVDRFSSAVQVNNQSKFKRGSDWAPHKIAHM